MQLPLVFYAKDENRNSYIYSFIRFRTLVKHIHWNYTPTALKNAAISEILSIGLSKSRELELKELKWMPPLNWLLKKFRITLKPKWANSILIKHELQMSGRTHTKCVTYIATTFTAIAQRKELQSTHTHRSHKWSLSGVYVMNSTIEKWAARGVCLQRFFCN